MLGIASFPGSQAPIREPANEASAWECPATLSSCAHARSEVFPEGQHTPKMFGYIQSPPFKFRPGSGVTPEPGLMCMHALGNNAETRTKGEPTSGYAPQPDVMLSILYPSLVGYIIAIWIYGVDLSHIYRQVPNYREFYNDTWCNYLHFHLYYLPPNHLTPCS